MSRMMLAALPVAVGAVLAGLAGLAAGAAVNWAVYSLAWQRRPVSPWSPPAPNAPPRRAFDRVPLWGWIGLRRESRIHGRGFWVRPLAVEALMAGGWAALYGWEVSQLRLVQGQLEAIAGGPLLPGMFAVPASIAVSTFVAHGLLLSLMAAATLIDVDEKTIPDGVTVPGTLAALVLAAAVPTSLLPHAALQPGPPVAGVALALPPNAAPPGQQLVIDPLTLAAPASWPAELDGPRGLAVGLACYATWCFALTPRTLRRRRGLLRGLGVLLARVAHELVRPPLAWISGLGAAAIVGIWARGGGAWAGLLTALVGLLGGGAMIWAVRIVGSAALRKEAMGFGDVTLMMMIGAFVGWQPTIFIFFMAPFAGLLVGLLQLVLRRDDVIPYGPFLCLATAIVVVRWADFWNAGPVSFQRFFDVPWLVPAVLAIGVVMLGAMLVLWRNIKEALLGRGEDYGP